LTGDRASTPMLTIPTTEKAWQDTLMLAATLGKEGSTESLTHRLLIHYWPEYQQFVPALQDYLTTHPIARQLVEQPSSPSAVSPTPSTPFNPSTPSTPVTPSTPSTSFTASDIHPPQTNPLSTYDPLHPESKPQPYILPPALASGTPALAPTTSTPPIKAIPVPPAIPTHLLTEHLPEEGLFLLNAGVILTHPFLSHLFKLSGLLASGKFIADATRQKAIHLLHYLSTGRTISEEFELAAAKILCGCPLEYPIEKQSIITPDEMKEADSLLEGLLNHWGVKNITVEGLRGNFLTRNGKLTPKNDKLHLVIEKHVVDILVRTYPFPWNMSIIKLPWLQQAIHLDW